MAWAGGWGGQQAAGWGGGAAAGGGWGGMAQQQQQMGGYGQQQMGGYGGQQYGQQAQAQTAAAGGWGGMGGMQQAMKPAAVPPQMMQAAKPAASPQGGSSGGETLVVTGCTHATVGGIVRGTFQLSAENHGKPAYKKDGQVNGLDVMCYFWDERDGPGFCGWWFGPVIGGDQVWAYHTDKTASTPPSTGWKVPYDGPVDPTLVIAARPKAGAMGGMGMTMPQGQPAQSQWSPQPQANAWNAQQQMQQQQQQKLMEQRKAMEEMKRKQEEMKRTQAEQARAKMEAMKKQQMEEQQKKLEENRKKLAEANARRLEEQKKKMEDMKKAQMELVKKREEEKQRQQEELKKKQLEQQSVFKMRKALQKFKAAMPHNLEAMQKEFDECCEEEMPKVFTQKEGIEKEITQAKDFVKTKLENIEKKKAEEEEKKKAEEERRKALRAKAEALIKELTTLVEAAEESGKGVAEEAEPFSDKSKDLSLKEIQSAGSAVEQAGADFDDKYKACKEFAEKNAVAMKTAPVVQGEPPATCAQDLQKLLQRMNMAKNTTTKTVNTAAATKEEFAKKAEAKDTFEKKEAVFKKYDSDKDGVLNRKEVEKFCKGLYNFTCPKDSMDLIIQVLVADGEKGVKKADLQRLKVMIGLAREKVMDDKRKEQRLAKEKKLADLKAEIEEKIAEANKFFAEAATEIQKVEKHQNSMPGKTKIVKAAEMTAAGDEYEGMINAAKATVTTAKDSLTALEIEVDDELKAFLSTQVKKLTSQLQALEARIAKTTAALTKYRADTSKRDLAELELLWKEALDMLRYHQTAKKLTKEGLFAAIASKKEKKIKEADFLKFFKTCEKPKAEKAADDEEEPLSISEEDLIRLFNHLDSSEEGFIVEESFVNMIRLFMKVLKATVISDSLSIKDSKTVRRLEPDEVVEIIQGPIKEETVGVDRLHVKCLSDDKDGWLTPVGNQGTVFLQEGGNIMKVVKETILTGSFVIGGKDDKKTKKLKPGETVEIREWGRKEETSGLTRMKVKVKSDGTIGWVTSIGNTGIVFLEMA